MRRKKQVKVCEGKEEERKGVRGVRNKRLFFSNHLDINRQSEKLFEKRDDLLRNLSIEFLTNCDLKKKKALTEFTINDEGRTPSLSEQETADLPTSGFSC